MTILLDHSANRGVNDLNNPLRWLSAMRQISQNEWQIEDDTVAVLIESGSV